MNKSLYNYWKRRGDALVTIKEHDIKGDVEIYKGHLDDAPISLADKQIIAINRIWEDNKASTIIIVKKERRNIRW